MNSIDVLQQLEEKARQETNSAIKYVLLQQLAVASRADEDFESAFAAYAEALNIARKMQDSKRECDTLSDLGSTAESRNEPDLAINFYKQALEIALKTQDFRAQNRIRGKLGIIYAKTRSINRAIEYIEQAIDAARIENAVKILVQEEQTDFVAESETHKNIRENLYQSTILQTHTEIGTQSKQVKRLKIAPRRIALIASIPLIMAIIGLIIFLIHSINDLILISSFAAFCTIAFIFLVIYALSPVD